MTCVTRRRVIGEGTHRRPAGAALIAGPVVAALLAACSGGPEPSAEGPPAPTQQVATRRITADGQARSYRLFVPAKVDRPAPLVIVLHDAGGNAESIAQATQLDREAAAQGFVVVYPESLRGTWNGGFCCGTAPVEGVDDVGFLDRLLDELLADPRIDPDRVYLTGASNGAVMAYRFACERAGRIAGVASVAGAMVVRACRPSEAVSVLEIRGTADRVVPYQGGKLAPFTNATEPVASAPKQAEAWATLNACPPEPTTRTAGRVTTTVWQPCRDGTAVRLVTIQGGGHTWYAREFGPVDGAVDATETIVRFFGLGPDG